MSNMHVKLDPQRKGERDQGKKIFEGIMTKNHPIIGKKFSNLSQPNHKFNKFKESSAQAHCNQSSENYD